MYTKKYSCYEKKTRVHKYGIESSIFKQGAPIGQTVCLKTYLINSVFKTWATQEYHILKEIEISSLFHWNLKYFQPILKPEKKSKIMLKIFVS